MAEVDVKKQSHEQQRGGELQRRGGAYPSVFGMRPGEFLQTNPFALMRRMAEEMDRVFEGRLQRGEMSSWMPAVEVNEHDGKLEVLADLPGINESDVKVEVTDEGLVIQGERKREREDGAGEPRQFRAWLGLELTNECAAQVRKFAPREGKHSAEE